MNKNLLTLGVVAVASAIGGAAGGYFLTRRHLEHHYEEEARVQIEEAKIYYRKMYKREQFDSPASAVEALIPKTDDEKVNSAADALNVYQGKIKETVPEKVVVEGEAVVRNIFANGPPRPQDVDENLPHIIPEEEFLENDTEFEQVSLTWYEGDNVLADEADKPIEAHKTNEIVGDENLLQFQHLGEDERTLYVRNPKLRMEFEISRSEGKFAEEVLGLRGS